MTRALAKAFLAPLLAVSPLAAGAVAATLTVPFPFPTIQSAIDAASPGDLVSVSPGTYPETIDFAGKAIAVVGALGAAQTIIDAQGAGSVCTFDSFEGPSSILRGFTLTGGAGTPVGTDSFGGGIYVKDAAPTIEECVVEDNDAKGNLFTPGGAGGGIFVHGGTPLLRDNVIRNNVAQNDGGGVHLEAGSHATLEGNTIETNFCLAGTGAGIHCHQSSPVVRDNLIRTNALASGGGGLHAEAASSPLIEGNEILDNGANVDGGGLLLEGGAPIVRDNRIAGNVAGILGAIGGGLASRNNAPLIERNVISDNRVIGDGGGAAFQNATPTLSNNLIVDNRAEFAGAFASAGGLLLTNSAATVVNCTLANNTAQDLAGGLALFGTSSVAMTNSIVWGNAAPSSPQIGTFAGTAAVTFCDVQGGFAGAGNLAADPLFADAPNGDYHLLPDSPCFDAGTDAVPLAAIDFEGDARVHYDAVDLGADEIAGCVFRSIPFGAGLAGTGGLVPKLSTSNRSCDAGGHLVHVDDALPGVFSNLWIGAGAGETPFLGGTFLIDLAKPFVLVPFHMPASGSLTLVGKDVHAFPGAVLHLQATFADPGGPQGATMTNGIEVRIGE
ncbi:MAG: right-handed parallel beta-helix repeat-containing protein [Planctomycetota bacterium JB042]